MVKKGNYTIENIYQGGYSSLDPNKAYSTQFLGYKIKPSELGAPTKPDTANQIQQVEQLLNQGIIPIEVGALSAEVFSQIPKQHFKEIDRLSKLTGAKISVHAPIVEPSGMGEQGWSEAQRQLAERQLDDVIEKAHELNSNGSVPITIHPSATYGSEYAPDKEKGRKISRMVAVEKETGKPVQILEEETMYYPNMKEMKPEVEARFLSGKISREDLSKMPPEERYNRISLEKGRLETPEERLRTINNTQWDDSINQVIFNKERADEILQNNQIQIQHLLKDWEKGNINSSHLTPDQSQALNHYRNASTYLEDTRLHIESLFNKAWKNTKGNEQDRAILRKASEQYGKDIEESKGNMMAQSNAMQKLLFNLKEVSPEFIVPIEKFAIEKSAQTFANVAFNAYNKFGEKGNIPKINIENLPSGMGFSSLEEVKNLILESKHNFAQRLIKEKGMSSEVAQKKADEIIGMTLDVGHLNISKKQGFQDKDLLKEMEQIAKYVKHVHLTDNFGFSDSHLPPGMGNVPFKEMLEKLDKEGFKGRKIVEAGGYVQHFGQSPYMPSLEAFGSPIYMEGKGPYWNQTLGFQQGYFSGYGEILPQNNYQTFGTGFSQLPTELGGNLRSGLGGRFSQRGME